MAGPSKTISAGRTDAFGRLACFLLFGTVGMGAVAVALLAEPLARYYKDQAVIEANACRIEDLEEFSRQQETLLANRVSEVFARQADISQREDAEQAEAILTGLIRSYGSSAISYDTYDAISE